MSTRAMLVAGLLTTGAAAATEMMTTTAGAAVARWDGKVIDAEDEIRGLRQDAREAIETWRTFAIKRGYRIDLDEDQRVMVVSDSGRFSHFRSSATVVERAMEALEPFGSPSDTPLIVFRASSAKDLDAAVRAAQTLGFASYLTAYVEDGSRTDRRSVDARLAEAIVGQQLSLEAPFLSAWMADGIASYVALETTGRALIDGEVRTLRSIQTEVARSTGSDDAWRVSLYEVTGTPRGERPVPREADALAIVAFLGQHHTDALIPIVAQLGRNAPTDGRAKYREEERALERHIGKTALGELSRALREGRSYRP